MQQKVKKALSLLLALSMVFSFMVLPAYAAEGDPVEITILATSDVHGKVLPINYATNEANPTVGLSMIASMIDKIRAEEDNVILVDGGDTVQGTAMTYYFSYFQPEMEDPMMKALRLMDYDFWTLGNHEFNNDLPILKRQIEYVSSPDNGEEHSVAVSAANLVAEGTEWDSWRGVPYVVKEFETESGTVKVGLIGLVTPNIPTWEVESHYEGIEFRNFVPTIEHFVPIMREQEGCDIVVAVCHAGVEDETSTDGSAPAEYENQVRAMINLTTGIDAVVSGHFHSTDYREDLLNADGKPVPVISGGGGEGLAYMKLLYNPATKAVTPATEENGYRFLKDQEGLAESQTVAKALAPYNEMLQEYLDQPLGVATGDFSNENISLEPTAIMDLLNKAQLSAVPAQLSICAPLTTGGDVRALIPQGGATMRLLYQLYVFENWLYRVNMTGEQLRLWLEHATTKYTNSWDPDYFGGGYYTDEIYGLDYEIHYYAPEGSRVQNMTYQGQPVQPDQTFSVVMNNYRFTGGAGFMQAAGLTPEDYSLTDFYTLDEMGNENGQVRNIVAQYIRDQKEITPTVESTWQFFRTAEEATAAGATVVGSETTEPAGNVVLGETAGTAATATADGTVYYRLRDLATVLKGTEAAFNVEWDHKVIVTKGGVYTAEALAEAASASAVSSAITVAVDGADMELTVVTVNGYNYVSAEGLAALLGVTASEADGVLTISAAA